MMHIVSEFHFDRACFQREVSANSSVDNNIVSVSPMQTITTLILVFIHYKTI